MAVVVSVVLSLFTTANAKEQHYRWLQLFSQHWHGGASSSSDFLLCCLRSPPKLAPCQQSADPTRPYRRPSPPLDVRCFCRCQSPPPPPPPAADEENLGDGEMEREPLEKKMRRARSSDVQIMEIVKYATVERGCNLEGYDEDDLEEFYEAIKITPWSFTVWMKNNKIKYLESEESSSSDDNGGSIV